MHFSQPQKAGNGQITWKVTSSYERLNSLAIYINIYTYMYLYTYPYLHICVCSFILRDMYTHTHTDSGINTTSSDSSLQRLPLCSKALFCLSSGYHRSNISQDHKLDYVIHYSTRWRFIECLLFDSYSNGSGPSWVKGWRGGQSLSGFPLAILMPVRMCGLHATVPRGCLPEFSRSL